MTYLRRARASLFSEAALPFWLGFLVPYGIYAETKAFSLPYWLYVNVSRYELILWPGSLLFWGSGVGDLWPYWLTILALVNGALYYCIAKLFIRLGRGVR